MKIFTRLAMSLSPAAIFLACSLIALWLGDTAGGELALPFLIIMTAVSIGVSFYLGFKFTNHMHQKRVIAAILAGVLIAGVNGVVASGGCQFIIRSLDNFG